jgi:hypothetical protein
MPDETGETTQSSRDARAAANAHVRQLIAPIGTEPTVEGVAQRLMRLAASDSKLASLLVAIQTAAGDGRDLLDKEQSNLLDEVQVKDPLDLPSAPEWLRPAIVTGYMLAKDRLTPTLAAKVLGDPHRAFQNGLEVVEALEPGFIGEFIVEAAASQRTPAIAERMRSAADEMRPMVGKLYADVPAADIAKAINTGGAGAEGCQACRGGACTPIDCWVIIIIIIIVIVAK